MTVVLAIVASTLLLGYGTLSGSQEALGVSVLLGVLVLLYMRVNTAGNAPDRRS